MRQVLRDYIGRGRMDKGTGAWPTLDKQKTPYVFAWGKAQAFFRNQHKPVPIGQRKRVDQTVFEETGEPMSVLPQI